MTKEEVYRKQMQALGIYEEIFEPEIKTLCRIERELTRAEKAWSKTAPPGGKPSFLDDHFVIIQNLRKEILQHREALGLTPKSLKRITGAGGTDAPMQKDLITERLDRIAEKVSGYAELRGDPDPETRITEDLYEEIPGAGDLMDEDLRKAVHEDMG